MSFKHYIKVEIIDQTNEDNSELVWSNDFNCTSRFDKEIDDAIYHKVLEFDSKFNFADYENEECPYYVINYYKIDNNSKKLIYSESCTEYIMNL